MRRPARRAPWLDVCAVHLINLFQAEAFRFGDEEVYVEPTKGQHPEEDQENEGTDTDRKLLNTVSQNKAKDVLSSDTRRKEGEQEVPQPVRSTSKSDGLWSDTEREGLS